MSLIHVRNLWKTFRVPQRRAGISGAFKNLFSGQYHTKVALDHISFSIDEGELVGYIGPNGAGKSTTVKILSGILEPTAGRCEVDGLVPWRQRIRHVAR